MTRPRNLKDLDGLLTDRTVILGVGNDIKGDDGVGPYVVGRVSSSFKAIDGKSVPEAFAHEIISLRPDILLIVDAAKMGSKPGSIGLFTKEDVKGISFSTHSMPISMLSKYIESETDCSTFIIGIEPMDTNFGMELTKVVRESADLLAELLAGFKRTGKD